MCRQLDNRGAIEFCGEAVRVLPEELRVRRAVGEAIGRGLRDGYQNSAPVPEQVRELMARLEHGHPAAELPAQLTSGMLGSRTQKQFGPR